MNKFLRKSKGPSGDQQQHQSQQQQQQQRNQPGSEEEQHQQKTIMGQFSSSEVQAASAMAAGKAVLSSAAVIGTENASEVREPRGSSTAAMANTPPRPSQPIDICRALGRPAKPVEHLARPMPLRVPTEAVSMMPALPQHQPRVIQPRRLSGSPSASLGPIRAGRNDMGNYRERVWHEAMRRRLLSLDSRAMDPECPSSSGENNKENHRQQQQCQMAAGEAAGEQQQMTTTMPMPPALDEASKKLSRSRKRLNSAELEYSHPPERESSSTCCPETSTVELATVPPMEVLQNGPAVAPAAAAPTQQQQTARETVAPLAGGRRVGRIAYLYGVYGQERQPPFSHSLLFGQHQQQRKPVFTADNATPWWPEAQQIQCQRQQQCLCCASADCCDEECLLELDEGRQPADNDSSEMEQMAVRLHTVGDIIGYAKVVRAQRQETLGRLNDVMSQFDALIRSLAMKTTTTTPVADEESEVEEAPATAQLMANTAAQMQQQQSKAITN